MPESSQHRSQILPKSTPKAAPHPEKIKPRSLQNRASKKRLRKTQKKLSKRGSPKGDPWGPQGGPTNHQPRTRTPKCLKTVFSLESRACRLFVFQKNAKIVRSAPVRTGAPFLDVGAMPVQKKWGPPPATCLQDLSQGLPKPPQGTIFNDFWSIFGSKFDKFGSIFSTRSVVRKTWRE